MTQDQFDLILHRMDVLEVLGGVAVIAVCATLFIVGYLARFRK